MIHIPCLLLAPQVAVVTLCHPSAWYAFCISEGFAYIFVTFEYYRFQLYMTALIAYRVYLSLCLHLAAISKHHTIIVKHHAPGIGCNMHAVA
jgi:hypothetical protein